MMDSLLLYKILKNRTGAEISASGNPAIMPDTLKNNPMNEMKVFGWSKQERTTGAQLLDIKNVSSSRGEIASTQHDGYVITAQGVYAEGDINAYKSVSIKLDTEKVAGKIITASVESAENDAGETLSLICDINYLKPDGAISWNLFGMNKPITVSIPADAKLVRCRIHIIEENEKTIGYGTYTTTIKGLMVSIGDKVIPWEPYTGGQPSPSPDYPQEIVSAGSDGKIGVEVRGKNLFELTGIRDNEYLRIEKIENNTIYARPTNMNAESPGTTNYSNGWVNFSEKIKVISGILYTISLSYKAVQKMIEIEKLDPARILVFKDSENIILNEEIKQEIGKYVDVEIPLLIPDGTDSIYFTITCNNCSVAIKNIQIEEGGYTFYEPYHEPQSLSISTPTGLPAIPVDTDGNYTDANGQQWIADYVDLKREKYVQNVCDLPLKDINLEWCTWGVNYIVSNGTGFYAYLTKYAHVGNTKTLATICQHNADAWGGRKIGCNAEVNGNYITISLHTSDLDDASDNKKAIESFKKIVEQTDAHVLYVRADPIERDLTPEEIQAYKNLVTYAGTTIVENDAECYMEVSAGGGDALRAKKLALILGD
ncbi:hypothetical protein [Dorea formicigenerans]|uniref:Uncharacterized protein n=1 Tax=Dorea formicigenerans TaxID=39486 RepID=A0A415N600_9FIRM|nr:hypothetical protein [Dorea formicigenerans]RHL90821.1 hypothetical protein DWZ98_01520 [Dorea formicigenerans]